MFEIGFSELLLVSAIALVVIGPEKLPRFIRTLSLWLARIRRGFMNIRDEIEAEIGAEEIKRQLRDDPIIQEARDTKRQLEEIIDSANKDLRTMRGSVPFQTIATPTREVTSSHANGAEEKGADQPGSDDRDSNIREGPAPNSQRGDPDCN